MVIIILQNFIRDSFHRLSAGLQLNYVGLLVKVFGSSIKFFYRYHITDSFPYTLGCFKGDVVDPAALRAIQRCGCTEIATSGCNSS